MKESLAQCEREVESARAKLKADLRTLASPETLTAFTDGLKQEAVATKDSLVQQAREAVQTSVEGLVEELKAKAAANPAAALIIGAGVAWQLIRNPPISTALIGAGLWSLWRTKNFAAPGQDNRGYLEQGERRLKQQMTEFRHEAASVAADVGQALSERTGQLYDAANEKIKNLSHEASEAAVVAGSAVKARTDGLAASAVRTFHDALDQVGGAASGASDAAASAGRDTVLSLKSTAASARDMAAPRDSLLLGVAGIAVAAAVGIALQKRITADAG
jgi:hypothetical protein